MHRTSILSVLFLLSTTTWASTVLGNPTGAIVADVGSGIYVDRLIATPCDGHVLTIDVEATLNQGDMTFLTLDEVDYCRLVVEISWDGTSAIEDVKVDGFSVYQADVNGNKFDIELDASSKTALLVVP